MDVVILVYFTVIQIIFLFQTPDEKGTDRVLVQKRLSLVILKNCLNSDNKFMKRKDEYKEI